MRDFVDTSGKAFQASTMHAHQAPKDPPPDYATLVAAAERNGLCTLVINSAATRLFKRSRFLAADDQGLWVEIDPGDLPAMAGLVKLRHPLRITFFHHRSEVFFSAPPLEVRPAFILSDKSTVAAVRLARPTDIASGQRRKNFRVPVRPDDDVVVRIWRINEYVLIRDKPAASTEMKCELRDISLGGVGVTLFARRTEAMKLVENQRFRVEVRVGKDELLFEGRLRYPAATARDDELAHCGIAFTSLDKEIESRRNLATLEKRLALMQRQIVRQRRAA
jgi:c-di-GMP-binding flagellar brake protein YcgR